MLSTEEWARSHGISAAPILPAVEGYSTLYKRSAQEVAIRSLILRGVFEVAQGQAAEPVIEWFRSQNILENITPEEKAFLLKPQHTEQELIKFEWHIESAWTLLWIIGKIESLGLPTEFCEEDRLRNHIQPLLGTDILEFVTCAQLRAPGELLAEDDRIYNLWCCTRLAHREGKPIPSDLNERVLYERVYAFEWLDYFEWDECPCDA
jgi:Domain of unknown function (DUF4272)